MNVNICYRGTGKKIFYASCSRPPAVPTNFADNADSVFYWQTVNSLNVVLRHQHLLVSGNFVCMQIFCFCFHFFFFLLVCFKTIIIPLAFLGVAGGDLRNAARLGFNLNSILFLLFNSSFFFFFIVNEGVGF